MENSLQIHQSHHDSVTQRSAGVGTPKAEELHPLRDIHVSGDCIVNIVRLRVWRRSIEQSELGSLVQKATHDDHMLCSIEP